MERDDWYDCECSGCDSNQFTTALKNEGYKTSALGSVSVAEEVTPPPWYNEKSFRRGQEFFHTNFVSIFISNLIGLTAILHVSGILSVLSETGKSSTVAAASKRYLSTLRHLYCWYSGDIFKQGDKANKVIQRVRNFHLLSICSDKGHHLKKAANTNNCRRPPSYNGTEAGGDCCGDEREAERKSADDEREGADDAEVGEAGNNPVPRDIGLQKATQVDMVATQWAFCGLAMTHTRELGIAESSLHQLGDFVHFWRTIGYLMGIQDRFNLCDSQSTSSISNNSNSNNNSSSGSNNNNSSNNKNNPSSRSNVTVSQNNSRALLHRLLVPAVAKGNLRACSMSSALLRGAHKIVPFVDHDVFLYCSYHMLGLDDEADKIKRSSLNTYQALLLRFQIFFLGTVLHLPLVSSPLRMLVNWLMFVAMTLADHPSVTFIVQTIIGVTTLMLRPVRWLLHAVIAHRVLVN